MVRFEIALREGRDGERHRLNAFFTLSRRDHDFLKAVGPGRGWRGALLRHGWIGV
jgi:hypothetical protein